MSEELYAILTFLRSLFIFIMVIVGIYTIEKQRRHIAHLEDLIDKILITLKNIDKLTSEFYLHMEDKVKEVNKNKKEDK